MKNQFRRFPRVELQASVLLHDQERLFQGNVKNISERGVFVSLEHPELLDQGAVITLVIRDLPKIGTLPLQGVIVQNVSEGERKGLGITFIRMNPKARRDLAQLVLNQLPPQEKPSEEKKAS